MNRCFKCGNVMYSIEKTDYIICPFCNAKDFDEIKRIERIVKDRENYNINKPKDISEETLNIIKDKINEKKTCLYSYNSPMF